MTTASDVSIDRLVLLIGLRRKEETNAVLSLATRRCVDQARLHSSSGIHSHWVQVSQAILRGPSPLTPAQRELIGAYVSSLNACQYCYGGHRAAAELFGVSPQAIDGLIQDLGTAPIEAKLRPLFAFVKKLTLTPTRMTQADADAVFAAGWDEAALHSAIAVCCVFNFMNRLVEGHGIKADQASFTERGRKHVEMGYIAQYDAAAAGKGIR